MQQDTMELIRAAARGVAEISVSERGLRLHRLPSKYAMFHDHDPLTQTVADQLSGVRLALLTSASHIQLTYRSRRDAAEDGSFVSAPSTVSFTCGEQIQSVAHTDGDLRVWNGADLKEVVTGVDSVAQFTLAATDTPRPVDIWLPHNCQIEIVDLTADQPLASAPPIGRLWVHYGSSISHCIEATDPLGVWPVIAARSLGLDLFNLGLAGSANIEIFAAQAIADLKPDVVTLKLGINTVNGRHMTRRSFIPAVHSFVDVIRQSLPSTPIMVISPIFCEAHEDRPGPTLGGLDGLISAAEDTSPQWVGELTLTMIREILAALVARRNDPHLTYVSGLELFCEADSHLMPDGLHPNADGYRLIGDRFTPLLRRILGAEG